MDLCGRRALAIRYIGIVATQIKQKGFLMRATVRLDDDLLASAKNATGITRTSALVDEGLRYLVQVHEARHLAKLGGPSTNSKRLSDRDQATTNQPKQNKPCD